MIQNHQNNLLDSVIFLTQKIKNKIIDIGYNKGEIEINEDDIFAISSLNDLNLIEVFNSNSNYIEINQLKNYIGQILIIEIKTGDIQNYYETTEDFINGNKFESKHKDFYIVEIDYRENYTVNKLIENYKKNLELINFLRDISESKKISMNEIELFFYNTGKGINLKINYHPNQLNEFNATITSSFKNQFIDTLKGEDKKQLFVNELINYLEKNGKSFIKLIAGWDNLISNYNKSYSLFLSGFSFEKIKTSSTEHFQKLVDRIYESIGKVSNYIFGIPIGYILIINNFDFTGLLFLKNFVLLIIGLIFFILIWFVLFKNIEESIDAIIIDINDFIEKIENVSELEIIKTRLEKLRDKEIKKQQNKLKLVKVLTILIYVFLIILFFLIFLDKSIFIM